MAFFILRPRNLNQWTNRYASSVITSHKHKVLGVKSCKRSRSLNKDIACLAVVPFSHEALASIAEDEIQHYSSDNEKFQKLTMISVMNLESMLRTFSPKQQLPDAVYQMHNARETILGQYASNINQQEPSLNSLNTQKTVLDGQYLDKIFGIKDEPPIEIDSCNTQMDSCQKHISLSKHVHGHSQVDNMSIRQLDFLSLLEDIVRGRIDIFPSKESEHQQNFVSENSKEIFYPRPTSIENGSKSRFASSPVVFFGNGDNTELSSSSKPPRDMPSLEELRLIQKHMDHYLPKAFLTRHDYRIYTQDITFENNFAAKPFVTYGLSAYVREFAKYRIWALFQYANIRMHVLKSTVHEDDGSVRIRWRITGIPQVRAFMFWKFLPWKYRGAMQNEADWIDGFSTLYVQPNTGLIWKHRLDKVIPDDLKDVEEADVVTKIKNRLNKLAPQGAV